MDTLGSLVISVTYRHQRRENTKHSVLAKMSLLIKRGDFGVLCLLIRKSMDEGECELGRR